VTVSFTVESDQANLTLAALLRRWLPGQSWSQVRKLVAARRVRINSEVWLDDARRLKEADVVDVLPRPEPPPRQLGKLVIRYLDPHIVVVEKPSGISTVRHPAEYEWSAERRALVPTLDDLALRQIGPPPGVKRPGPRPRLRVVQRLDKATSGLVVFARTVEAERGLGQQFRRHTVVRRYLAVVPGKMSPRTIRSSLIKDRGDGRRGSTTNPTLGKEAITHVEVAERLLGHTLLSCRLETGRTHQIRIHLAEQGHPVCGDRVYGPRGEPPGPRRPDQRDGSAVPLPAQATEECRAPRLALHAVELGFTHPVTEEPMHWEMPLPEDLRTFVEALRPRP
jgi:23S rRNA pseudouridine1911/1915/1917 synthase